MPRLRNRVVVCSERGGFSTPDATCEVLRILGYYVKLSIHRRAKISRLTKADGSKKQNPLVTKNGAYPKRAIW